MDHLQIYAIQEETDQFRHRHGRLWQLQLSPNLTGVVTLQDTQRPTLGEGSW